MTQPPISHGSGGEQGHSLSAEEVARCRKVPGFSFICPLFSAGLYPGPLPGHGGLVAEKSRDSPDDWSPQAPASLPHHAMTNPEVSRSEMEVPVARDARSHLTLVKPGDNPPVDTTFEVDGWTMPDGWRMRSDGIHEKKVETRKVGSEVQVIDRWERVSHRPIWIEYQIIDIDMKIQSVMVAAVDAAGRKVRWQAGAEEISDRTKLLKAASLGMPVNSCNALSIVRYLAAGHSLNGHTMPSRWAASRQIWRKLSKTSNRADAFNIGTRLLRAHDEPVSMEVSAGADIDAEHITRFDPAGEEKEWAAAFFALVGPEHPVATTVALSALASPVVHMLRIANRVVELAGPTSGGKSTAQRLAMSLFGDPEDSKMPKWNGTKTAIERMAVVHGNLPFIIDENAQFATRGYSNKDEFRQVIFNLASGADKARSNKAAGLRASDRFRLNVITSGEVSAQTSTDHAGIYARVISFWGSPFTRTDSAFAGTIKRAMEKLGRHHGHAGARFIQHILDMTDEEFLGMQTRFLDHQAEFMREAGASTSQIAGRIVDSFAAFRIAGEWLESAYPEHFPAGSTAKALVSTWKHSVAVVQGQSQAGTALDALRSYIATNQASFQGAQKPQLNLAGQVAFDPSRPPLRYLGKFTRNQEGDITEVSIIYKELDRAQGVPSLEAAVAEWRKDGILLGDRKDVKKMRNVRIGEAVSRCLVFRATDLWPAEDQRASCMEPATDVSDGAPPIPEDWQITMDL